ncbi:MAG TPA: hypothetical protein VKE70_20535, partial [Candidatus Solibacter sp.]|nr:hypothetical protein [Candidatus Solibacter sp.]
MVNLFLVGAVLASAAGLESGASHDGHRLPIERSAGVAKVEPFSSRQALASSSQSEASGKFILHKFAQPIGTESYTITRQGDTLSLNSEFAFNDRGTNVPLKTSLRAALDYSPETFTINGKTCRACLIDSSVEISDGRAQVRQEKETRSLVPPGTFFSVAGYAPVAMQMAMIRYWRAHGSPPVLSVLPSGEVRIQERGSETLDVNGHKVALRRFGVRGLIWGLETLWMDGENNLVALVSTDAEFDHFEALRQGYEAQLSGFIAGAARDEMAALTELSTIVAPPRAGLLAVV